MQFDMVMVSMAYPGASPEDVQDFIAQRIENALVAIDEVDELSTTCVEGSVSIVVSFKEGTTNIDEAIDEVRRKVESLQDLPSDVERPLVYRIEPTMPVIMVQLWGDIDKQVMKQSIRDVRDDLRTFSEMGAISVGGDINNELTVELEQDSLIEHGISISTVSDRISTWMRQIPGGTLRSSAGDIVIRSNTPDESSAELEEIVIRSSHGGETLRLGDIATVKTTLVDIPVNVRFNEEPAMNMFISKSGDQDIVLMAEIVRAYVAGRMGEEFVPTWKDTLSGGKTKRKEAWLLGIEGDPLPTNTSLSTFTDLARFVEGRMTISSNSADDSSGVLLLITISPAELRNVPPGICRIHVEIRSETVEILIPCSIKLSCSSSTVNSLLISPPTEIAPISEKVRKSSRTSRIDCFITCLSMSPHNCTIITGIVGSIR